MLRGAKHLNACRTKAQQHHRSHTCAPFYSPARGGSPLLIPPHAGERKGAVVLRGAKHLNACPTKAQRHHQSHTCAPFDSPTPTHDGRAIIWPGRNSSAQEARGHSLPVYGEGRGGAHSLPVYGEGRGGAHSLPVYGEGWGGAHSLPVYGEGWGGAGQEAAQHHSGQPSCCFPARGGTPRF
jgi:hypothetical protein